MYVVQSPVFKINSTKKRIGVEKSSGEQCPVHAQPIGNTGDNSIYPQVIFFSKKRRTARPLTGSGLWENVFLSTNWLRRACKIDRFEGTFGEETKECFENNESDCEGS